MIINHNMSAINANRQMAANQANTAKSTEKLSSGLRINRAGDDAAGLAISEKMRAQIAGLNQSTRNAQDGISLIQTAEGALNESHSILQRMRELAVQSSNDTNTDDDRVELQKEIEQLTSELDRIGNDTEFNTKKLIDGSIGSQKVAGTNNAAVISDTLGKGTSAVATTAAMATGGITASGEVTLDLQIDGANISVKLDGDAYAGFDDGANVATDDYAAKLKEDINKAIDEYNKKNNTEIAHVDVTSSAPQDGKISITSGSKGESSSVTIIASSDSEALGLTDSDTASLVGTKETGSFTVAGAAQASSLKATDKIKVTIDGTELEVELATTGGKTYANGGANDMDALAANIAKDINDQIDAYNGTVPADKQLKNVTASIKDGALVIESGSEKATSSIKFEKSDVTTLLGLSGANSSTQGGGVEFQIGANAGQTMKVTIEDMRADALGVSEIDVKDKDGATSAIDTIDKAITKVSAQRSSLGAVQNRLEHTINNLGTSSENLTAAESRIRDVDMAKEMMEFTKNNVLSQASQAMLAQAKALPNQVLSLLQ